MRGELVLKGSYRLDSKNNLYILSRDDIDFEAQSILKEFYPIGLEKPCEIPLDDIIDKMGINLVYRRLSKNKDILGVCIFDEGKVPIYDEEGNIRYEVFQPNTIIINSNLVDDDDIRYGSTIGHELGHYVTQGDLYIKNKNQISLFDLNIQDVAIICKRESSLIEGLAIERKNLVTKLDWMEWQANYFSSAIIVPKITLLNYLKPYFEKYDNCYGKCILNNLDSKELMDLLNDLTEKFHVSAELMINRLKNLNLLQNHVLKEEMTLWS